MTLDTEAIMERLHTVHPGQCSCWANAMQCYYVAGHQCDHAFPTDGKDHTDEIRAEYRGRQARITYEDAVTLLDALRKSQRERDALRDVVLAWDDLDNRHYRANHMSTDRALVHNLYAERELKAEAMVELAQKMSASNDHQMSEQQVSGSDSRISRS